MKNQKSFAVLTIALVSIFSVLMNVNTGFAQLDGIFGQNKVQYETFKWKFLQSKHFDVYFYQGGEYIAEYTAQVAESSLVSIGWEVTQ